MGFNQQQEAKVVHDSVADSQDKVQVLKGIQPKHQFFYKLYKFDIITGFLFIFGAIVLACFTRIEFMQIVTQFRIYRFGTFCVGVLGIFLLFSSIFVKKIFLRKAPFDSWILEIAEKRLGTTIIFYDSKYIYINYDRSGKEVDKREFVTEMSDKSIHYSYFYIQTFVDQGVIMVECKKRQPIPNKASFSPSDDTIWNAIPLGLAINTNTQKISPIAWYLNDMNIDENHIENTQSVSILIAGGTGCFEANTPILMYDTLIH